MQVLEIHKLGPIEECVVEITPYMVLTGPQASGKSTIAKATYFFKSVKNVVMEQMAKLHWSIFLADESDAGNRLKRDAIKQMRLVFMQIFGSTWGMDRDMKIHYEYTPEYSITVSLTDDPYNPNYLWFEFSEALTELIGKWNSQINEEKSNLNLTMLQEQVGKELEQLEETVYIPAGRSMMTLLSGQINYLYSTMDDTQKRTIDYCTQNYLERIMRIKNSFSEGMDKMVADFYATSSERIQKRAVRAAGALIGQILKGEYRCVSGEERLLLSDDRYIKINFASSGQQEAIWILNILFYHLLYNKQAYFIIEEPESNLFPEAQMYITELISLVQNYGHKVFVTTHSPYVLGTMNNLLFADSLLNQGVAGVEQIISPDYRIHYENLTALYLEKGMAEDCKDEEEKLIRNEVIDGASRIINKVFDDLMEIFLNNRRFVIF